MMSEKHMHVCVAPFYLATTQNIRVCFFYFLLCTQTHMKTYTHICTCVLAYMGIHFHKSIYMYTSIYINNTFYNEQAFTFSRVVVATYLYVYAVESSCLLSFSAKVDSQPVTLLPPLNHHILLQNNIFLARCLPFCLFSYNYVYT